MVVVEWLKQTIFARKLIEDARSIEDNAIFYLMPEHPVIRAVVRMIFLVDFFRPLGLLQLEIWSLHQTTKYLCYGLSLEWIFPVQKLPQGTLWTRRLFIQLS